MGSDSASSPQGFQRLFELSMDMLGTASPDGYFTALNPAWERTLGWTRAELMAEPFVSFVHPEDLDKTIAKSAALAEPGTQRLVEFENRYRTRDGDYRCLEWSVVAADGVLYFVAKDVTGRKSIEAERDDAAKTSQVVLDSLGDGVYVADPTGRLSFINPVGLRLLGYDEPTELTGRVPHEIFHHTRWDGTPYPIEDCPLPAVRTTGTPVSADEDVFWRRDGSPISVSYTSAPVDLRSGRGSVVVFRDATALKAERDRLRAQAHNVVWFERVRDALDEDRFVLFGQPVIDLKSGSIAGHELLLRMVSHEGETISPGLFLPAAEKYGLINEIDLWVISRAAEEAAAGRHVAANLSAESVGRVEVLLHIERALARTGAAPQLLTFEVTETALMGDLQAGRRFADRLVALGCSFSLDDFGTGFGSLTYLRQLPITHLKIDVQFVREMATDDNDRKLVEAIVQIAQSLGKQTIAEGVEDERTLEMLRAMGVDYAQGYHLGRPTPLDAPVAVIP